MSVPFCSWSESVKKKLHLQTAVKRRVWRWTHAALDSALEMWKESASGSKRHKHVAARFLVYLDSDLVLHLSTFDVILHDACVLEFCMHTVNLIPNFSVVSVLVSVCSCLCSCLCPCPFICLCLCPSSASAMCLCTCLRPRTFLLLGYFLYLSLCLSLNRFCNREFRVVVRWMRMNIAFRWQLWQEFVQESQKAGSEQLRIAQAVAKVVFVIINTN